MGRSSGFLTTTTQLLEALHRDGTNDAWPEFDGRYRPILEALGRRLGLGHDDAADVAQQALAEFAEGYRAGAYDRDRGRLRSWLLTIARRRVIDQLRRQQRRKDWRGQTAIDAVPDEAGLTRMWDEERDHIVFRRALERLRAGLRLEARTMRTFERVAVDGVKPEIVAQEFGITIDNVYRIKSRLTRRLRELVEEIARELDDEAQAG